MFTIHFLILCAITLMNCEKNCRKILINSENMSGDCCVFIKDEVLRCEKNQILETLITESLSPLDNPKNGQLSSNQRIERIHLPKFLPTRPDDQNMFTPTSHQNLVVPINSDKMYGECHVFTKDKYLRYKNNNIVATIIQENLSLTEYFEGKGPSPTGYIQERMPPPKRYVEERGEPLAEYSEETESLSTGYSEKKGLPLIAESKERGLPQTEYFKERGAPPIADSEERELPPTRYTESRKPLLSGYFEKRGLALNERAQGIQPNIPPRDFSPRPIARDLTPHIQKVFPQDELGRDINQNHRDSNAMQQDNKVSDLVEEFDVTTAKTDLENLSTLGVSNIWKGSHKYNSKDSITLEQQTTFSTINIENVVSTKKTHNILLKDLNNDDSSDILFPTEKTVTTTVVNLDNRNAVAVPPIGCPKGQARFPDGECKFPF